MKVFPKNYEQMLYIYLPILGLMSATFYFDAFPLLTGIHIHWLLLPMFLLALCHPNTRQRIPSRHNKPRSLPRWLAEVALFQAALLMVFLGFSQITLPLTPVYYYQSMLQNGLYPFVLFSAFAGAIALAVSRGRKGLTSSTLTPWFNNTHRDSIGIITDAYARSSTMINISLTLTTLALVLISGINQALLIQLKLGLYFASVTVMGSFVIFSSSQVFRRTLRPLISQLPYVVALLLVTLGIVLCFYFLYFTAMALVPHSPFETSLFKHWDVTPYSQLLNHAFMLSWGVTYAGVMVHLSQGYRIWEMMLASIMVPAIFMISKVPLHPGFLHALPWLCALGAIYVLTVLLRESYLTYLQQTTVPSNPIIKQRSPILYLTTQVTYLLCFLGVYISTGIFVMAYVAFAMVIPVAIVQVMATRYLFSRA